MEHKTGYFNGRQDFQIYYQGWLPQGDPLAVLLVVHGLAEHGGRYTNVVEHFVPRGYAVYAPDHRGHGHSQGQRVCVECFTHYVDDLKTFFDLVRGWHPRAEIFLVGHSMGGTISLAYALRHQDELAGLILSGASIKINQAIPAALIPLGKLLSAILPRLGLTTIDCAAISRDPEAVTAYDNDPLVYRGKVTARLGVELIETGHSLPGQASQLHLPTLIMHGGADQLVDPQGSRWLYEALGAADKTLQVYEGFYHEIFNEPEHERVLNDVEAWLSAHL